MDEKLTEKNRAPTTVLRFLSRLTEKAENGKTNVCTALITEEEYLESESKSVLGKLCGRSV